MSIYIVEVKQGKATARLCVIAASATDAGAPYEGEGRTIEVGRIGKFEPGIVGAQMHALSGDEMVSEPLR